MPPDRDNLIDPNQEGAKEILTAQLGKAIDAFTGQYNLMIQIATTLVVADVTLVGPSNVWSI